MDRNPNAPTDARGEFLQIVRFLQAGIRPVGLYLFLLLVFSEGVGLHFIVASMIAFPPYAKIMFSQQKNSAFRDYGYDRGNRKRHSFFVILVLNWFLGMAVMYIADQRGIWPMYAQWGYTCIATIYGYIHFRRIFSTL